MTALLVPRPDEQGRASHHLDNLLGDTCRAWAIGLAAISSIDLDLPSRVRGRSVRDVLLTVGTWPESYSLAQMVGAATAGETSAPPRSLIDTQIRRDHAHADLDDIRAAWSRCSTDIEQWQSTGNAAQQALLPVGGPLGVVPLATLVGASAFQLVVALRDAGITPTSQSTDAPVDVDDLLRLHRFGLHALIDSAGAMSARYTREHPTEDLLTLRIMTSTIRVGFGATAGAWRTAVLPDPAANTGTDSGPQIDADAGVMIDIAAGRKSPITAAARREISFTDPSGLLSVATALSTTPDLPGGDALRAALATAQGARGIGSFLKNTFKR